MDSNIEIVVGQVWFCDRDKANIEIVNVGDLPCLDGFIRTFIQAKISHPDTHSVVTKTTEDNFRKLIEKENLQLIGNAKMS